jgi:uncharacterized membrane protein YdjX (TVP38/TMEM64 family)
MAVKQIVSLLGFIILIATTITLFSLGYIQEWALFVGNLHIWGHVIFILFFLVCGQPFGWGYVIFIQTAGFVYGWFGIITVEIGTILGALLGFLTSRYCLKQWSERKIDSFPESRRNIITAAQKAISKGTGSCLFFTLLRTTPALTFGWVNCLCGALTNMSIYLFVSVTVIGTQFDIIMNIYLGIVIRELSSYSDLDDGTATYVMIVQIVLTVILLIGTTLWGRYFLKRVLAEDVENPSI